MNARGAEMVPGVGAPTGKSLADGYLGFGKLQKGIELGVPIKLTEVGDKWAFFLNDFMGLDFAGGRRALLV